MIKDEFLNKKLQKFLLPLLTKQSVQVADWYYVGQNVAYEHSPYIDKRYYHRDKEVEIRRFKDNYQQIKDFAFAAQEYFSYTTLKKQSYDLLLSIEEFLEGFLEEMGIENLVKDAEYTGGIEFVAFSSTCIAEIYDIMVPIIGKDISEGI